MNRHALASTDHPGGKYNNIQVLRFVAALMVIVLHATYYTSERLSPGLPLYHQGSNGVRLFFVISGFVMIVSSSHLKAIPGGWKIFSIKRIIRIVPIYWIVTTYKLLVLVFASSLVYHAHIDAAYIVKSYLFIPATNVDGELNPLLGVGWTLNFEMFFYLLFAIALVVRINTIMLLGTILIALSVVAIYKTNQWPDIRFYFNPIILDFLYGMIAARLIVSGKKLSAITALLIILAGLLYLFFPGIDTIAGPYAENEILIGIVSFAVIYAAASVENKWGAKMPAWLIYLGGASYSLYLIHPVITPLAPTLLKVLHIHWSWLSVLCGIVIALIAGTVCYTFCEKPVTQWLSKHLRHKVQETRSKA